MVVPSTRSVAPTEAGQRLLERLEPALNEVHAALDGVNSLRDRPAGTLRLNVPVSAARLVLPAIVSPFLAAYPEIRVTPWEFERDGDMVRLDPVGPLLVQIGAATDLAVDAAIAGTGIVHLFEDWLRPHLESGALEAVLEPWWQRFPGPFLYYPGRRLLPAPLRAFVDFIK